MFQPPQLPTNNYKPYGRPTTMVEATDERQKCRRCKEFFADIEYGGLCSACFKKLTIEESTQKPFQYQSQYQLPPTQRPLFNFNQPSSVPQPYGIPKQCKAYGCSRNAAVNCQGYCAQCFK